MARLRDAGLAHKALTGRTMLVNGDHVWLTDMRHGDVAATRFAQRGDLAQALVATALAVGPERAVDSALRILGPEAVGDVVPLLQPLALPRRTRQALREQRGLLAKVRDRVVERAEPERLEPAPIERFKPQTLHHRRGCAAGALPRHHPAGRRRHPRRPERGRLALDARRPRRHGVVVRRRHLGTARVRRGARAVHPRLRRAGVLGLRQARHANDRRKRRRQRTAADQGQRSCCRGRCRGRRLPGGCGCDHRAAAAGARPAHGSSGHGWTDPVADRAHHRGGDTARRGGDRIPHTASRAGPAGVGLVRRGGPAAAARRAAEPGEAGARSRRQPADDGLPHARTRCLRARGRRRHVVRRARAGLPHRKHRRHRQSRRRAASARSRSRSPRPLSPPVRRPRSLRPRCCCSGSRRSGCRSCPAGSAGCGCSALARSELCCCRGWGQRESRRPQ